MRRINVRFAAVLVAALALLSVGAYSLNRFQVRRNAGNFLLQADRAEEEKQLDKAADYLSRYLALNPDDADTLARHGFALDAVARNGKERVKAFLTLERALQLKPSRDDVRRRLVPLALRIGRFSDASEHVRALLMSGPGDGELFGLLGQAEELAGRPQEAKAAYEKAAETAPQEIDHYLRLAGLLRRTLNQPGAADGWVEKMTARNPDSSRAHLMRGAYYREFGQAEKAAEGVTKAHALAPDDAEALLAMALLSRKPGDDGRSYLLRGLELHPKDTRFPVALADAELRANRREEAVRRLREARAAAPADHELLWGVADRLLDAGEPAESREIFAGLRKANYPAHHLDYLDGRLLLNEGSWRAAAERFNAAKPHLARAPELAKRANFYLGQCHERLGNPEAALAAYRQASAVDPAWAPARAGVASASMALGKIDTAVDEYRALQERSPETRLAFARTLIQRNLSLPAKERNWAETDAVLAEAEKAQPDSADVPVLKAEVLAAQNKLKEAEALLNAVPAGRRKSALYWVARTGLAERMGQPERVLPLLDEAQGLLGKNPELESARARHWARQRGPKAVEALAAIEAGLETLAPADQTRVRSGLAEAHYRLGREDDARRLWARVADASGPENSLHVRSLLFDLALRGGDDAAARKLIAEIRSVEGDEGALWRYGEAARLVRLAQGGQAADLDQARAYLAEVSQRRPAWSRVPLLEAGLAELAGDAEAAIKGYVTAIERGEQRPDVVRRAVQLLYERRRYVEADQVIRKLPEQAPISGDLVRVAAELSLRKQDTQRALDLAQGAGTAESRDYRDRLWIANVLWAAGKNDEAERHLRQAVALAPAVADPRVALVQFLARTGQRDKATAALDEARGKIAADALPLALAQGHEILGQADQAERLYEEAVKARPDEAVVRRAAADYYLRRGRPAQAQPHLKHLLEPKVKAAPGELAWARRGLAFTLATQDAGGDLSASLALLDENRRGREESPDDQRARAVVLALRPARHAEAARALEDLRKRQPLSPEEEFLLAKLYDSQGDWRKSREALLKLVSGPETRPTHLGYYVTGLLERGETQEAGFWLARLERAEPESPRTLELKVRLLHQGGKTEDALAALRAYPRAKEVPPAFLAVLFDRLGQAGAREAEEAYRRAADAGRPSDLLMLANFTSRQPGRLDEALGLCERAWQAGAADEAARVCVAVLRAGRGDARQVRRVQGWLAEGLKKRPTSTLLLAVAELHDLLGQHAEAVSVYRRILAGEDRNVIALNNLAWLLALKFDRGDEALGLIDRALAVGGANAELLDTRAVICLKMNRPDLALRDLDQALARKATALVQLHRAQAHLMAKDRTAAAQAFQAAQALGLRDAELHPLEQPAYRQVAADLGVR